MYYDRLPPEDDSLAHEAIQQAIANAEPDHIHRLDCKAVGGVIQIQDEALTPLIVLLARNYEPEFNGDCTGKDRGEHIFFLDPADVEYMKVCADKLKEKEQKMTEEN